ncbi:spidroin-1-like isoform X2 [Pithys albifrons albifrons]|uniref:spidroin-1-like isoform X2 n=1 Tax=Pithys albifrons albifrons TaxID=3385563 RepID=UPI003A5CC5F3
MGLRWGYFGGDGSDSRGKNNKLWNLSSRQVKRGFAQAGGAQTGPHREVGGWTEPGGPQGAGNGSPASRCRGAGGVAGRARGLQGSGSAWLGVCAARGLRALSMRARGLRGSGSAWLGVWRARGLRCWGFEGLGVRGAPRPHSGQGARAAQRERDPPSGGSDIAGEGGWGETRRGEAAGHSGVSIRLGGLAAGATPAAPGWLQPLLLFLHPHSGEPQLRYRPPARLPEGISPPGPRVLPAGAAVPPSPAGKGSARSRRGEAAVGTARGGDTAARNLRGGNEEREWAEMSLLIPRAPLLPWVSAASPLHSCLHPPPSRCFQALCMEITSRFGGKISLFHAYWLRNVCGISSWAES